MIDNKFTEEVQAFLNQNQSEQDAARGAELLIRINPRNVSYRRFLQLAQTRPSQILAKIVRELGIHLKYRLDGLTLEAVRRLDQEISKKMEQVLSDNSDYSEQSDNSENPSKRGRRPDHDSLPDEIKALWDKCADLYKEMKQTFEQLKARKNEPSCQRYDLLHLLDTMDKHYHKMMEEYDNYQNNRLIRLIRVLRKKKKSTKAKK